MFENLLGQFKSMVGNQPQSFIQNLPLQYTAQQPGQQMPAQPGAAPQQYGSKSTPQVAGIQVPSYMYGVNGPTDNQKYQAQIQARLFRQQQDVQTATKSYKQQMKAYQSQQIPPMGGDTIQPPIQNSNDLTIQMVNDMANIALKQFIVSNPNATVEQRLGFIQDVMGNLKTKFPDAPAFNQPLNSGMVDKTGEQQQLRDMINKTGLYAPKG